MGAWRREVSTECWLPVCLLARLPTSAAKETGTVMRTKWRTAGNELISEEGRSKLVVRKESFIPPRQSSTHISIPNGRVENEIVLPYG